MTYTKRALKGTFIVLLFSVVAAILGYAVRLLLARNLSLQDFGLFYALFSLLALLSVVRTFGFDRSLAKFIPEYIQKKQFGAVKGSMQYVMGIQLIANIALLAIIFLCADTLALEYFKDIRAAFLLKLFAVAFFIDSFVLIIKYAFQGFQRMELYAGMDIARMLITITVLVIGIHYGLGILGAIIAYIAAPVVLLIAGAKILAKNVFPLYSSTEATATKKMKKRITSYSIFMLATSLGAVVGGYTDMVMLTYFKGLEDVGLYSIALPLAKVLALVPYALMGILIPLSTELWVTKKYPLLKEGYQQLLKMGMIVMIPACAAVAVFARQIIIVLFGSSFAPATLALQILCMGMLFEMLHIICYSLFAGIGKPEINSKIVYTTTAVNVIGNIILIPPFGILGAAAMMAASYFMMMVYGLYKMKEVLNIRFPWRAWGKTALAAAIGISLFVFMGQWIFPLSVFSFGASVLVYGIALLCLKSITIGEIKNIVHLLLPKKT